MNAITGRGAVLTFAVPRQRASKLPPSGLPETDEASSTSEAMMMHEVVMGDSKARRWILLTLTVAAYVSVSAMLASVPAALATSSYADATGQRCASCHVGQPSQAVLTADGQRFAAIPTHRTDPAGAWAIVVGSGAPIVPVQVPSQLPRTGDARSPTVELIALFSGLALMVIGGVLATGGRRRLGLNRRR